MSTPLRLTSLLLISTALVAPAALWAQDSGSGAQQSPPPSGPPPAADAAPAQPDAAAAQPAPTADDQASPDISIPGGNPAIVVTGQRQANIAKTTPQVVSVLSTADIARTGEGDISGALTRVTGLSVVGRGFVYVRGLGDRYSSALMNGSPLPSPEPLKRVVPLDIFPTSVIASSLVQKSYSVNFPAEFGGGVINLTTRSTPRESFLTLGTNIGGDSETFNNLGYVYRGGKEDWTGFDNGTRDYGPNLKGFLTGGQPLSGGLVDQQAVGSELITSRKSIVQRNTQIPPNWEATVSAGTNFEGDDATLGVIATAGIKNSWLTRDSLQQVPASADLVLKSSDFERVTTDDRTVVDALLGIALDFGKHKIRLTDLYIRDTLKEARVGIGTRPSDFAGADFSDQRTAWYERQLFDTQLTGEFRWTDWALDARGSIANTKRKAPFETDITYIRTNSGPFGNLFINPLNNNAGIARVAFSNLSEDLYSGGIDLSYKAIPQTTITVGYAYSDTKRYSDRRGLYFLAGQLIPTGIQAARPDLLLSPGVINAYKIGLNEDTDTPAFNAKLRVHGAYAKVVADFGGGLTADAGVRYESALETASPAQIFSTPISSTAVTKLDRDYVLPAVTVTWAFQPDMQLRFNISKTLARPQFRELIYQRYFDPDTNRYFQGNPLLTDSQLYNTEVRYEWYLGRDQRISVAGFYKKITKPIETYVFQTGDVGFLTTFANAPKATLYGAEAEVVKYFDLQNWGGLFSTRRLLVSANYTYTQSKIEVSAGDTAFTYETGAQAIPANTLFKDGAPLTGQSDHVANLELGIEDTDKLSQQTFLLSYASPRVTSRGSFGIPSDIMEKPGFRLDFVAREAVDIAGVNTELKLEVRNITGTKYQEYQKVGDVKNYYNLYDVGTTFKLGASVTF